MSSTRSKKYKTLKTETQELNMTFDEYSRWLCLLEGIEHVGKRVEQLQKRSINCNIDWIKPLAFEKYIQERFLSMKSDLDEIEMNNTVKGPSVPCTTSQVPVLV